MRLRNVYEKRLEEKARILNEKILPTSYRASIEDKDLETLIAVDWIEASCIEEITERQIYECVEERFKQKESGEQLNLIDQIIEIVYIQMHIADAGDRLLTLYRDYCNAFNKVGYTNLQGIKPHVATVHIMKKLKPHQLYKRMMDMIECRKNGNLHDEDFHSFRREVATKAEKLQVEQRTIHAHSNKMEKIHTCVPHPRKSSMHDAKRYTSEKKKDLLKRSRT